MLDIQNLTLVRDGKAILNRLNLRIHSNEIHSILGLNGTGKTTLAYVIMGLPDYKPDKGRLIFHNRDITHLSISERAKLGITLAWQEPARFEGLTVKEYLAIGQRGKTPYLKPEQCLERVGLDPVRYLHRQLDTTLSGGERKRIELAAVLAMEPQLVVLDEPDSGIDALSIDYIKQVIRTLVKLGAAVILITHHEEVAAMADRASSLCAGEILKTGSPEEVTRFFRNHCEECPHVNQPKEEEFAHD